MNLRVVGKLNLHIRALPIQHVRHKCDIPHDRCSSHIVEISAAIGHVFSTQLRLGLKEREGLTLLGDDVVKCTLFCDQGINVGG